MAGERSAQRRLLAAMDRLEPSLRRQVLRALESLKGSISVDALAAAIEQGDRLALERLTRQLSRDLRRAVATVERAYQVGQAAVSGTIAASLNLTNPIAVRAASEAAAQLVTRVTSETRTAIREIVTASFERGLTPRDAAKLIRPLLGLSERQMQAVLAQRDRDEARGLSLEQIEARAQKYADRLIRIRAEMIARTELIRAANQGQIDLWRQMAQEGLLGPATRKRWLVADDDRLCPACDALNGEAVPLDQQFSAGVDGPPLHPNCRCTLTLAVESVARSAA